MATTETPEEPGDTYFLARSNIIGGACLTTVFGMGTGMAKRLLSPGICWLLDKQAAVFEKVNWPQRGSAHEEPLFPPGRVARWEKVVKPIVRLVPVS